MLTKLFVSAVLLLAAASGASAQLTNCANGPVQNYCAETVSENFASDAQTFGLVVAANGDICEIAPTGSGDSVSLGGLLGYTFHVLPQISPAYASVVGNGTFSLGLLSDLVASTNFATGLMTNTFAYNAKAQIEFDINLQLVAPSGISFTLTNGTVPQIQLAGLGTLPITSNEASQFHFITNVATVSNGSASGTYTVPPLSFTSMTVSNSNSTTNCNVGVVGDPQFVGLRGQSYQVHGIDGGIYNLVSSARTQVNAQFVFLSEGQCPVVEGVKATNCWSHPGSYLGAVAVQQVLADGSVQQLVLTAGSAKQGFASLELNGKALKVGDLFAKDVFSVSYDSTHTISVKTEQFSFVFDNSDMFINQAVGASVPLSQINAHGLLGQTSNAKVYNTPLRYIAGEVDDYLVSSNDLFASNFVYNKFSA